MKINSINISRRASYEIGEHDKSEFKAFIAVNSDSTYQPSITITLSEEQLEPIIGIISQLVAQNMADAAKAFHEEVQASLAGPPVEQEQIEDNSTDVKTVPTFMEGDDEVSF